MRNTKHKGALVWTANRQPQQTASYRVSMIQTRTVLFLRPQKWSQVVLTDGKSSVLKATHRCNRASTDKFVIRLCKETSRDTQNSSFGAVIFSVSRLLNFG